MTNKRFKGTKFAIAYKDAPRIFGESNIGTNITASCDLMVKQEGEGNNVTLASTGNVTVNIPAALVPEN